MKNSQKKVFVTIFFAFCILFGIVVTFRPVDEIILKYVQIFFDKTLRKPERWINILQTAARIFIFFTFLIYFLFFLKTGINVKNSIKNILKDLKVNLLKENLIVTTGTNGIIFKKTVFIFAFSCIFLFIAYFNIITANFFYQDDIFRNYSGTRSWIEFSRYISDFFSIFLHNNLKLNDIAPLTQILSIIISAITLIILSQVLTQKISLASVLPLSIIFIFPFYSQNISYRFDSPYMALSIFFAVFPFLFEKESKAFIFTSVIGLILTCFSYQAALSLYILVTIYLCTKRLFQKDDTKKILFFVLKAVFAFCLALILFKLFFMNEMEISSASYFSTKISLSSVFENIKIYSKITLTYAGGIFTKLIIVFALLLSFIKSVKNYNSKKLFACLIFIVSTVLAFILSFGPYLIFERPTFTPRSFMGFNAFIALIFLNLTQNNISKKSKILYYSLTLCMIYSLVVFLYTYGNCLKNQTAYENFRVSMLIKDISEFQKDKEIFNISIKGSIDQSQKNQVALKNYPLIKDLITPFPNEYRSLNDEIFKSYNLNCTCDSKELTEEYKLIKDTYYHAIYKKDENLIVVLK